MKIKHLISCHPKSKLFVPYKTSLSFPLYLSSIGAGNVLCSPAWPTILKLLVYFTWSHLAWQRAQPEYQFYRVHIVQPIVMFFREEHQKVVRYDMFILDRSPAQFLTYINCRYIEPPACAGSCAAMHCNGLSSTYKQVCLGMGRALTDNIQRLGPDSAVCHVEQI